MERKEYLHQLQKKVKCEPDTAKKEIDVLLAECREDKDVEGEIECQLLLSDIFSHTGDYTKALEYIDSAKELADITKDKKIIASIHNYSGTIYWYQGEYPKALQEYLMLKEYAEQLQDKQLLFNAYNNIGMIYWIEEDYDNSIKMYEKALYYSDDKLCNKAANALNNIGLCYIRKEKYLEAQQYLQKALNVFTKENDLMLMANSYINIANCLLAEELGDEALQAFSKALDIKRKIKDCWGICHCINSLTALYMGNDMLTECEPLIQESLDLSAQLKAKPLLITSYQNAARYYELAGNYKKALEYEKIYNQIWQEMHTIDTKKQIAELEKNFSIKETEKENEIFRLRNIELKKKNDLIEKQKIELNHALAQLKALNDNLNKEISKQLEQIRQKDQMLIIQSKQAAMGEMLACIAHQWKQPLNGISVIIQNLTDAWDFDEFDEDLLDKSSQKIIQLVEYMSDTINDFRDFFKPDKKEDDFSLRESVERTMKFVNYSLKRSNISVKTNLDEVSAHGYPNYYSQVVMNIINNARDVLEERHIKNPEIAIKTYAAPRSHKPVLTIEDNAGGIPQNIIKKVFNPYFTTKPKDKGTGLGLYMSKVIIEKNMNGKLSVSNTKAGAKFKIEL